MPRLKMNMVLAGEGKKAMETIGGELESLQEESKSLRKNLRFQIRQRSDIDAKLKEIESQLFLQQTYSINLARCMETAMSRYRQSEQEICRKYGADGGIIDIKNWFTKMNSDGSSHTTWSSVYYNPNWGKDALNQIPPFMLPLIFANPRLADVSRLWNAIPKVSAGFENKGVDRFGVPYETGGSIETRKVTTSVIPYMDISPESGNVGVGIIGMASAALLSGRLSGSYGLASGEINAAVGVVSVIGEARAGLMKGGKFAPELYLKANARAEGITGEVKGQLGTDENNIHVQAKGYVGVARGEAKCVLWPKDDGLPGKNNSSDKVALKVGVGAAALSGTAKGGITICGINIDLSVTGEVGAVGIGAGFAVGEKCFELEGKLAVLAGLGAKLRISRA